MNFRKLTLILSFLWSDIQCLNMSDAHMAIDYFAFKNVKQICCFTCTDTKWLRDIAMMTSAANMSISALPPHADWRAIENCMRQQYTSVGVLIDIICEGADIILEKSSEEKYFDAMHNWLMLYYPIENISQIITSINDSESEIINGNFNVIKSATILEKLNLSIDAEITAAFQGHFQYELFDVYNFGKIQGGHLNMSSMGKWTIGQGLNISLNNFKYQRRWNFHGLVLRAISVIAGASATVEFRPEQLTEPGFTQGVSAMTKISSMILDLLREKHNFRFNYTIVDRWVGAPQRNSKLTVTNSLLWREQDISSTSMRLIPAWLDWVDAFFPRTTYLETKFYYRIPTEGIGMLENEFLRPFSNGVWMCILCACSLCGIALAAAAKVETRPKAVQFALFTVIASYSQQMFEDGIDPERTNALFGQSRRIALVTTGVSGLLLYNYYTSSVVSWLLSAPAPTISSLDELVSSSLEVVLEDMGYTRSWLEVPGYYFGRKRPPKEDELREKKVKTNKRKKPVFQTLNNGIELVRQGGFAYHTEPYNANIRIGITFSEEELCDLGSLQMMERSPAYIVGQPRSPYREFFVWSMMRAQERGHIKCIQQRVQVPTPECSGSAPRAMDLGGAAPAFLLLVVCGWMTSTIILLFEIFIKRCCY